MDFDETENQFPEEKPLAIYSKWAILGFSIFFSPAIGGILLMINLRSIGRKTEGYLVLISTITYTLLCEVILMAPYQGKGLVITPRAQFYSLALYVLAGGILAEVVFKKYFPGSNYQSKSIWRPLFILLALGLLLGYILASVAIK